jgi:hypothetical protein
LVVVKAKVVVVVCGKKNRGELRRNEGSMAAARAHALSPAVRAPPQTTPTKKKTHRCRWR